MEPVVTSALITAGAKLFNTLVEVWNTSRTDDKKQTGVNKWLDKHYDLLHDSLSTNCVNLLSYVDDGKRLRAGDFLKIFCVQNKFNKKTKDLLKSEFRYRLEFMVLLGVIRHLPHIGRYEITRLGVSFLSQARANKHYSMVLLKV